LPDKISIKLILWELDRRKCDMGKIHTLISVLFQITRLWGLFIHSNYLNDILKPHENHLIHDSSWNKFCSVGKCRWKFLLTNGIIFIQIKNKALKEEIKSSNYLNYITPRRNPHLRKNISIMEWEHIAIRKYFLKCMAKTIKNCWDSS